METQFEEVNKRLDSHDSVMIKMIKNMKEIEKQNRQLQENTKMLPDMIHDS